MNAKLQSEARTAEEPASYLSTTRNLSQDNSNHRVGHDGSVCRFADIECNFLLNHFAKPTAGFEAWRRWSHVV
jgi:hypothetical protein